MIFEKEFLLMAKLKATYMSHKPCKNLKYKCAMKTLWASNDNALLKHMESHALFKALEENDSQSCNGHIF
jgi:hypothetical protein